MINVEIRTWNDRVRIRISRTAFRSCWVGRNFCLWDVSGYLLAQLMSG